MFTVFILFFMKSDLKKLNVIISNSSNANYNLKYF